MPLFCCGTTTRRRRDDIAFVLIMTIQTIDTDGDLVVRILFTAGGMADRDLVIVDRHWTCRTAAHRDRVDVVKMPAVFLQFNRSDFDFFIRVLRVAGGVADICRGDAAHSGASCQQGKRENLDNRKKTGPYFSKFIQLTLHLTSSKYPNPVLRRLRRQRILNRLTGIGALIIREGHRQIETEIG